MLSASFLGRYTPASFLYLTRSKVMLAFTVVPSLRRRDALSAERQGYSKVATEGSTKLLNPFSTRQTSMAEYFPGIPTIEYEGPHPWSGFASVRSLRLEKWESHGCKAGARMKREEPIRSGISITVVNRRTGIFTPIDASC